jgi:hypothetical protein
VVGSVLLPSRESPIMPDFQTCEELELRRRNLPEYVTSLSLSLSRVFLCFYFILFYFILNFFSNFSLYL